MNIDENKIKLEEEKRLLEEELGSLGRFDKIKNEWDTTPDDQITQEADENDLADRSEDYEERSGTMSVLLARLKEVDNALGKIKSGGYGICESCGKTIEDDRITANPSARNCKECMNKVI